MILNEGSLSISDEKYQAIFFDFDGVLAESATIKTEAFAQIFKPYGEDIVNKVVNHHITHGGISRYEKIKLYYRSYLKEDISNEKLQDVVSQFSQIVKNKVINADWVKGAKPFLEKYNLIIDLYLVSGTPIDELETIVRKRNMYHFFKGVYGAPDTKPDITQKLIAEKKYQPDKTLYIGDSLSDYYDARKAGIPFLGRVPKEESSPFPKNISVISDFYELV